MGGWSHDPSKNRRLALAGVIAGALYQGLSALAGLALVRATLLLLPLDVAVAVPCVTPILAMTMVVYVIAKGRDGPS